MISRDVINTKKKVKKGDHYENSGTVILKSIEITQVCKLCTHSNKINRTGPKGSFWGGFVTTGNINDLLTLGPRPRREVSALPRFEIVPSGGFLVVYVVVSSTPAELWVVRSNPAGV
jgi:hypothetical protein